MNKSAGIYKEYKKHFLLDEGKLRKFYDVIREHAQKLSEPYLIKIRVQRQDDSFYETTDIGEVLTDENAAGRTIKLIGMELHRKPESQDEANQGDLDTKKASVLLIFDRYGEEKVAFQIREKERDWCFLMADELDSQIRRVLTKSPILGFFPSRLADPIVFFSLGALALFYLTFLTTRLSPILNADQIQSMTIDARTQKLLELAVEKHSSSSWVLPISLVVMALVFAFLGLRPISRVIEKMSRSVFYWGDIIPVHDAFEKRVLQIKWSVIVAFIVSLVASIIGALAIK